MKRVVCFGELMLRLSPPGHERLFQSPQLRTWFGGSEANVAVGLAHLGRAAGYVTKLPENAIGDAALAALRAEGLETSAVVRGGPRLGAYYVESGADIRMMRVVYDRAGSSFSLLQPSEIDWASVLGDAEWLHLSGITPALGNGPARTALAAAEAARAANVPVSIDLNYRPALWTGRDPQPFVRPLAAASDVVIGNPGAVEAMLGIARNRALDGADGARDVATRLAETLGCRQVALTHRETLSASEHGWSAALHDARDGAFHVSRRWQVQVVDRVGGGDSFAAGLIYALLEGRDAASALEFATAASALKLTIPGDFNRVSADEVDHVLTSAR